MSIKPIDFNVIHLKSQELNSHKIAEHMKHRNIVDSNFVQREKVINQNKSKVLDAEKTEHTKINRDPESNKKYEQQEKRRKRENTNKKKKASFSGHKIDIQI